MHRTATSWDVGKICWVGVSTICRCTLNDTENKTSKQTKKPHHIQDKKHLTSYSVSPGLSICKVNCMLAGKEIFARLSFSITKQGKDGWVGNSEAIHG